MSRPFVSKHIEYLEALVAEHGNDKTVLQSVLAELGFRKTQRAGKLKAKVVRALGGGSVEATEPAFEEPPAAQDTEPAPSQPTEDATSEPPPTGEVDSPPSRPAFERPFPPITNKAADILSAWTALEVLSPPAFLKPEDLAGGDRRAVADLGHDRLPWDGAGERSRPGFRLFYQIVLGTVKLGAGVSKLLARYADTRDERPSIRGEGVLALIIVDREGRPVEEPAVAISSFGWGISKALIGDLQELASWPAAETALTEKLDGLVRRVNDANEVLPVNQATIIRAYRWLIDTVGLTGDLVEPPRFAIRSYENYRYNQPPEPLLLNSFFLSDIAAARASFANKTATANLRRYLGVDQPPSRYDLLRDRKSIAAAVAPKLFPSARWPSLGRHPLVLLQQAAVNLALSDLRADPRSC